MTRRRVVVIGSSAAAAIAATVVAVVLVLPSNGSPVRLTAGGTTDSSAAPTPDVDETPSPDVSQPSPSAEPSQTSVPTDKGSPKASVACSNVGTDDLCSDGKPGWGEPGDNCYPRPLGRNTPPAHDLRLSLVMDSTTLVTATEVAGTVTMQNNGVEPVRFDYVVGGRSGSGIASENAGLVDARGTTVTGFHYWAAEESQPSIVLGPGQSKSFGAVFKVVNCGDTAQDEEPAVPPGSYGAVGVVDWFIDNPGDANDRTGTWVSEPVPVTVVG